MITNTQPSSSELYRLAGYKKNSLPHLRILPPDDADFGQGFSMSAGYSCTFHWNCMQYSFVSASVKNILGYNADDVCNKGLVFFWNLIHPEERGKIKEVYEKIFSWFYNTPASKRSLLRFSYNVRIKAADNSYISVLNQSIFTQFTDDGKPITENISCTDITTHGNSNSIKLTIHRLSVSGIFINCYEHEFGAKTCVLSKRELQILNLVKYGNTSKAIASQLNLSIETIKNHRKNILQKTGACNITEAVWKVEQQ